MADQFDKKIVFTKLKQKAITNGFNLTPNSAELPKGTVITTDLLEVIAETISEIFKDDQTLRGTIKASSLKLGPTGLQQAMAYKNAKVKFDATTDPKFFIWLETFHSLIQAVYPEPGFGAPNVFNTALKALLASKPTSITARITDGSSKVKITI